MTMSPTVARPAVLRVVGLALAATTMTACAAAQPHSGSTGSDAVSGSVTLTQGAPTATQTTPAPMSTTPPPPPAPAPTGAQPGVISMQQVAAHNTPASCWSVVAGKVYDLTQYAAAHPGGAGPITHMCGKDATAAFDQKHGHDGPQGEPQQALAKLQIGVLEGATNPTQPTTQGTTEAPAPAPTQSPAPTSAPTSPAPQPTQPLPAPVPGSTTKVISRTQVGAHSTPSSCWTVVDNKVYDVTSFASRHPGGADPIAHLCGIDGTEAFTKKHGHDGPQGEPQQALAKLQIGVLAGRDIMYTRTQVGAHSTTSSCWTVVGRDVYDLTKWMSLHPGGEGSITAMCGNDSTAAFEKVHGHDGPHGAPQRILAKLRIGGLLS